MTHIVPDAVYREPRRAFGALRRSGAPQSRDRFRYGGR
ncbi:MAG: hypothetical protein OJF62_001722 [Pseudolabrys sp.]|nr:hypothetical protein [Pseudolabrys sp.]